jgi:hypothetical protein
MSVAWWQRVGIAYVALYWCPPAATRWLVLLTGRWILGFTLETRMTGSGDTSYHYVELAVKVALAVVMATLWHLAVHRRAVAPRTRDHARIFVRYVLGGTMLAYGWLKLIPTQMPPPGPERLIDAIGDTSPMGLLWTFMGASPAYQMFAGLAEAVGGVLLFWRRTTLLGALILAGALANVVALNFCYDVPVKLFSTHLLGMALVLVVPHARRLTDLLLLNRATNSVDLHPFPLQRVWVRRTALVVKMLVVLAVTIGPMVTSYRGARSYGVLAPRHPLSGVYRVGSLAEADGAGAAPDITTRWRRLAVGTSGERISVVRADGTTERAGLTIDPTRAVWTWQTPDDGALRFAYRVAATGVVTLDGTLENRPVQVILTPEGRSRLLGRGFHWVNEYPFSR